MKKSIFIALAVLAGSTVFAQKKLKPPPPPPPPPTADVKEIPPPPPSPAKPPAPNTSLDYKAFLKRNPTVKGISLSGDKVHIQLNSGKEQVFDLNKEEDVKKLKEKYGELPAPPPPPPAPKVPETGTES